MPWPDVVRDLAAYSLQIACITLIAELMVRVVPVRTAGFGYAYWRLVLAAALVMPWLLRVTPPAVVAGSPAPDSVTPARFVELPAAATVLTDSAPLWPSLLPWVLAAGCVARLLWVAAGIARLRMRAGTGVECGDPVYADIQHLLGTRAVLRSVPDLAQPVTFGVRRPVVLLPDRLADAPEALRRAVVTHELVHVQRRDWLWVVAEEALRAVLWFHPAIWWVTSRIRRAREEFTDQVAVLATGSRRAYMEALLSFADTTPLQPAPAFARRAHLFQRVVLLSKEIDMSSQRVVVSGAVATAVLVVGTWYASEAFPVTRRPAPAVAAQAQAGGARADGVQPNRVTPENPIPRRVASVPIPYPQELRGSGLGAALDLGVIVDAFGNPSFFSRGSVAMSDPSSAWAGSQRTTGLTAGRESLRGVAAPGAANRIEEMDIFRQAVVDAVSQWQYEPPARAPLLFYVSVSFAPDRVGVVSQSPESRGVSASGGEARIGPLPETAAGDLRDAARRALAAAAEELRAASRDSAGAAQRPEAVAAAAEAIRAAQRNQTAAATGPVQAGQPLRVGGAIQAPTRIRQVYPVYPDIARAAQVRGVVIVEAVVDEQGRVADAKILRSIPLLDQAALDAVRQWQYTPTLLNGVPVPVIMTVTVPFGIEQ